MSLLQSRRLRRPQNPFTARPLVRKDLLETTRLAVCEGDGECPICKECYQIGKSILRVLPCEHSAHHQCIDLWFTRTSQVRCPLCMQTFHPQTGAASNTSIASSTFGSDDSYASYSSVGMSVSSPNLLDRFQRGELLTTCGGDRDVVLAPVSQPARSPSEIFQAALDAAAALEADAVKENQKPAGMFGPPNLFCRPLPPRLPAWLNKN